MTYEYNNTIVITILGLTFFVIFMNAHKAFNSFVAFLFPVLIFTGTLYGLEGTVNNILRDSQIFTIYTRGGGQIGLSFMNLGLLIVTVSSLIFGKKDRYVKLEGRVLILLPVMITVYYIVYAIFGVLFMNITVDNAIGPYGIFNFLNLTAMMIATVHVFRDPVAPIKFINIFLYATLFMAVFGLVRLPFGGDPANYYAVYERKGLVITYFDIGQNALFAIALCFALLDRNFVVQRKGLMPALVYLILVAAIILSFRRTAWIGLGFVLAWIFLVADPRLRRFIVLPSAAVVLGVIAISSLRFADGSGAFLADITDSSGSISASTGRFLELTQAIEATGDNPLFGLGPWHYNDRFSFDHGGAGPTSFVHSSIVHMYLKMGLLGLVPYLALIIIYPIWWVRNRRREWQSPTPRAIGDAFFSGFLFFLPDLLFGTPLISFRHAVILGLCFSVPIAMISVNQLSKSVCSITRLRRTAHLQGRSAPPPRTDRFGYEHTKVL